MVPGEYLFWVGDFINQENLFLSFLFSVCVKQMKNEQQSA